jgi:hypothetical protein
MLWLTVSMLVLLLTVTHKYISNSILFFLMSCQTICLYGFNLSFTIYLNDSVSFGL